ncbi:hypothetical protein [Paraburkholderia phytofirmans]|uniref:hypothetical protein n=1 Tax=Paraburkholderia phytofirmans TaxID=261302 RepID=UPI0011DFF2F2|nr:hypothetical protein [Paraburkholderia phytofirmans]
MKRNPLKRDDGGSHGVIHRGGSSLNWSEGARICRHPHFSQIPRSSRSTTIAAPAPLQATRRSPARRLNQTRLLRPLAATNQRFPDFRELPAAARHLLNYRIQCFDLWLPSACCRRNMNHHHQQRGRGEGHFRALPGNRYGVLRSRRELRIEPLAGLDPSGFQRLPFG